MAPKKWPSDTSSVPTATQSDVVKHDTPCRMVTLAGTVPGDQMVPPSVVTSATPESRASPTATQWVAEEHDAPHRASTLDG